jgi:hypothetical protein
MKKIIFLAVFIFTALAFRAENDHVLSKDALLKYKSELTDGFRINKISLPPVFKTKSVDYKKKKKVRGLNSNVIYILCDFFLRIPFCYDQEFNLQEGNFSKSFLNNHLNRGPPSNKIHSGIA